MPTKSASMEAKHSQVKTNWITPPQYLRAVRRVFGGPIALDAASCFHANTVVKAQYFFDEHNDGLSRDWFARNVYCNPPGSDKPGVSSIMVWLNKMEHDHGLGYFQHGILCAFNVDTSTRWFQHYAGRFPISLPDHRIRFLRDDLTPAPRPTHANAFLYFGDNAPLFMHVFSNFGAVLPTWHR